MKMEGECNQHELGRAALDVEVREGLCEEIVKLRTEGHRDM